MRVMVTGRFGFIGGWVVQELERAGHSVVDGESDEAPQAVIHLGALVGHERCEAFPELSITRNVTHTHKIAAMCASEGIPMVYASTIGARLPTSMYELTKAAGETMALHELGPHLSPGGSVRLARIAFTYGPGVWPGRNLIASMLQEIAVSGRVGWETPLWDDTIRPWIYVQDVARGLVAIVENFDQLPLVVDVGQQARCPTIEATALMCGQALKIGAVDTKLCERDPRRPGAVYPNDVALWSVGWSPQVRMEQGFRETAAWLADQGVLGEQREQIA